MWEPPGFCHAIFGVFTIKIIIPDKQLILLDRITFCCSVCFHHRYRTEIPEPASFWFQHGTQIGGIRVFPVIKITVIRQVHMSLEGADLDGGAPGVRPLYFFCRDRVPDFVWAPQAKRMHQIVQINLENYKFSPLLRGHIPLRHPPVLTGTEVLSVLNLGAPSFKKSWIRPWLASNAVWAWRYTCVETCRSWTHWFCLCFSCVVGKNPNTPNLSPMADDVITRSGIRVLGSPLYVCDFHRSLCTKAWFG